MLTNERKLTIDDLEQARTFYRVRRVKKFEIGERLEYLCIAELGIAERYWTPHEEHATKFQTVDEIGVNVDPIEYETHFINIQKGVEFSIIDWRE